jgi:hypothetical protein
MLLKGRNGNELELSFVREALPESQDGFGDDAWCTVIVRAATGEEEWEESSPCLNMYEFANLADWLEALGAAEDAAGAPEVSEVELLEPELKFSATHQAARMVAVRVGFHLDQRPEEFAVDAQTDEAQWVDVYVDRGALATAAATLRAEIERITGDQGKDDLRGEQSPGIMGLPDEDLNMVDGESPEPPFAGTGEDNAGER